MRTTQLVSSAGLTALVALATACGAQNEDLNYLGTLDTPTNGVVLFEDGEMGHAAMAGTTCAVQTNGTVAADVDVTDTSDEEIVDGTNEDGGTVLARTRGKLHTIHNGGFDGEVSTVDIPSLVDARFGPGISTVVLTDCAIGTLEGTGFDARFVETRRIDDLGCAGMDPHFAVDRASGDVFVGNDQGVFLVGDTVTRVADASQHMAWSPVRRAVTLANDTVVSSVDVTGAEAWSVELPGAVHSVADLGSRGDVAVFSRVASAGSLYILDGETGEQLNRFEMPDVAEVVASADGETLALVLDDAVHYYRLR